jgi:hypothetical protein
LTPHILSGKRARTRHFCSVSRGFCPGMDSIGAQTGRFHPVLEYLEKTV